MPCNFASREKLKIKCNDESGHGLCGNHRIDNWHPLISQIAGDCQIVSACQLLGATKPIVIEEHSPYELSIYES